MEPHASPTRRQFIGSALGLTALGVVGLARLGERPSIGVAEAPDGAFNQGASANRTAERVPPSTSTTTTTTTTTIPLPDGPLTFPVEPDGGLTVLDNFGGDSVSRGPCQHKGIDIFTLTAEVGRPLYACVDGVLTGQRFAPVSGAQGNAWILTDAVGDVYRYHHLDDFAEDLEEGSVVARGQLIGYMGTSGNANFPHLHFEVRRGSTTGPAVNPLPLLSVPEHPELTIGPRDGCDG